MPILKSSVRAYKFAQACTGYGIKVETPNQGQSLPQTDIGPEGVKETYKKFDILAKQLDKEEREEKKASQLPKPRLGALKEQLGIKDDLDEDSLSDSDPEVAAGNYSKYFQKQAAFAGCAHDRSQERILYNRPTKEKLDAARRFRMEGNVAFKQKDFKAAEAQYQKALLYYDYTFPESAEDEKDYTDNKIATHLNMATALYNKEDYQSCIRQCRLALKMDSALPKAYYRIGQAYLALDMYDQARQAFVDGRKFGPEMHEFDAGIAVVAQKEAKAAIQRRKVAKKIFSSGVDECANDVLSAHPIETEPRTTD